MTAFAYRAARADGVRLSGVVDAPDAARAAGMLSAQGLFPLDVSVATGAGSRRGARALRALASTLGGLAALLRAGVPLGRALAVVAAREKAGIWPQVRARIADGQSLAGALDESGGVPPIVTGFVRAGEAHGRLADALESAAGEVERSQATRAAVREALTYPAIVLAVGVASLAVILIVVVPRFAALLSDMRATLPPLTRLLLSVSALLHGSPLLMIMLALSAAIGGVLLARSLPVRQAADVWTLELPLLGEVRHALAAGRVCRTAGALLVADVGALEALELAAAVAGSGEIARRTAQARRSVEEGKPIGLSLATAGVVPEASTALTRFADETHQVGVLLMRAGELEERQAHATITRAVKLLEPALIVLFGAIVALVAGALLQGVYSMRPGT